MKLEILDSTLRDGAQGEGINYSLEDKVKIFKTLDKFGIGFIEGGNPSSNPKETEFFSKSLTFSAKYAKLISFGATRKKNIRCEDDPHLLSLINAGTEYVSVFGKASYFHVTEIINTAPDENLRMIDDTIRFCIKNGKKVFFDAEHFFDGYKNNPDYAEKVLLTAQTAGACRIVLCDTNGGTFPSEVYDIVKSVKGLIETPLGIHCHNDIGCATACTIAAIEAGATQIQGTFIGIGERCGNTNLSVLIPSLQLKMGYDIVPEKSLLNITETARKIAEISNIKLRNDMPYVGKSAFAHKGGMHADGVRKNSKSFEHINPESVGNKRNILLSEVAGRGAVMARLEELLPELNISGIDKDNPHIAVILEKIKENEKKGLQYEAAEASFELLVKREFGLLPEFFSIEYFKIIGEQDGNNPSTAVVKINVGGTTELAVSEGNGPVNAIDKALRNALAVFYPVLNEMALSDYKVRIIDSSDATAAITRVLIESTDGVNFWTTVGGSPDIINASVIALTDSILYKLIHPPEAGGDSR